MTPEQSVTFTTEMRPCRKPGGSPEASLLTENNREPKLGGLFNGETGRKGPLQLLPAS